MTDTKATTTHRRLMRWSLYAGVLLLAIGLAYLATRNPARTSSAGDTAASGAMAGMPMPAGQGAPISQPVMLTAEQARRIGVTYAVASLAPLAREIRTVGQVTYDETRMHTVSLKVDGWVERLYVNVTGQSISTGEPLLAIYAPMLVTAQEELLLAKRLEHDVAGGDAAARENASSLVASARRRLAYWDVPDTEIARVEQSGQAQRTLTLRSPLAGFVVEKNVLQGQRVMAGESLYRIANLGTVWVEGEVFERDLPAVRVGQMVRAELDALAGRARTGRITYVYPTLNADTRTVRVRVELSNPRLELKPGMYATLAWQGAGAATLSVPRASVVSTGQRNLVFVKRADGMLEPRLIEIGSSTSDRVEVLRGLAAGDTVVRSATFLVDAESNLGTLLGGMGNMPGMDMTTPTRSGRADADSTH